MFWGIWILIVMLAWPKIQSNTKRKAKVNLIIPVYGLTERECRELADELNAFMKGKSLKSDEVSWSGNWEYWECRYDCRSGRLTAA